MELVAAENIPVVALFSSKPDRWVISSLLFPLMRIRFSVLLAGENPQDEDLTLMQLHRSHVPCPRHIVYKYLPQFHVELTRQKMIHKANYPWEV